ncbi:hypothetical protein BUALT_Bualt13G0042500 [Buddleja alternifolia]|uniref:BHLH domain-containing protein n=1 Tax=Buddleja alternifolia TaxID=168488 RepID=A0AAV6WJU3_9LAMI|nr:hypothetical protein BUALT_Bualt13G0042500 [Buddleja alternifolia]
MADHNINFKQYLSSPDHIDQNINFINHFPGLNQSLMGFSHDNFFPQLSESPGNSENFPGLFIQNDHNTLVTEQIISRNNHDHKNSKRKAMRIISPENSSANSYPHQGSDNGITRKKSGGRGKKVKDNDKEVVHVRAKRGQATDSHSLAERVRRGRINERLKCLQDIVPGCYKTMGMAAMLDEITNYVQSLQNQVEFLSMKLTAASTFYDFNLDIDAIETMQRAKEFEALKIQNSASPGRPSAQFAQLDLNFGYYSQLPQNL